MLVAIADALPYNLDLSQEFVEFAMYRVFMWLFQGPMVFLILHFLACLALSFEDKCCSLVLLHSAGTAVTWIAMHVVDTWWVVGAVYGNAHCKLSLFASTAVLWTIYLHHLWSNRRLPRSLLFSSDVGTAV